VTPWTAPKYPGDAVRITLLRRANDIGDVRIQDFRVAKIRDNSPFRVAAYLPGIISSSGALSSTAHQWCVEEAADGWFDRFVKAAKAEGWTDYTP
jgi:hypothetical protein